MQGKRTTGIEKANCPLATKCTYTYHMFHGFTTVSIPDNANHTFEAHTSAAFGFSTCLSKTSQGLASQRRASEVAFARRTQQLNSMPPLAAGCQASTASINRHHLQLNTFRGEYQETNFNGEQMRADSGFWILGVSVTALFWACRRVLVGAF